MPDDHSMSEQGLVKITTEAIASIASVSARQVEGVAELGQEALRPFQNLEKTYFEQGEQHLRRRDNLQATENFVNSIFDEKLKMIQASPVSQMAAEHLDTIFLNYQVSLEE